MQLVALSADRKYHNYQLSSMCEHVSEMCNEGMSDFLLSTDETYHKSLAD